MLSDYTYPGLHGRYWIKFDALQDGRVKASAGLIPGSGGWVGSDVTVVADTDIEADRLLLAKLKAAGA